MSNILIIKHGSLGDLIQANGAIQDIKSHHKNTKVLLLTSSLYANFMSGCPYIDGVLIDKRLPRWNLIYLINLRRMLLKYNFIKVYDLQNSSRTSFYKRILFPNAGKEVWSSSLTTLPKNQNKDEFDKLSVLNRFNHQLSVSGVNTKYTLHPSFNWACEEIDKIKKIYNLDNYIILFPFCSQHLVQKKWPYYNDLINMILKNYENRYKIIIAPGPNEINEAKKFNAEIILNEKKALNISQLASLIKSSSFVVANDTGPAHMAAHLNSKGLALFGKHTTAYKVSIEREHFKAIQVENLEKLSPEKVFEKIKNILI